MLFGNAVKLIKKSNSKQKCVPEENCTISDKVQNANFRFRDYVKDSFSVLITKPCSRHVMKVIRAVAFAVTGSVLGIIIAAIGIGIFLQFGSVENSVISSVILKQCQKAVPSADFSMKSAMFRWNTEAYALEIDLQKVKLDDFVLPRVSILPDYTKSLIQQKLVVKNVTLTGPNIDVDIQGKSVAINPNFEKGGHAKELLEPISFLSTLINVLNDDTVVKFVNANVFITENGAAWRFQKVYCEQLVGENYPRVFDGNITMPNQKYVSRLNLQRINNKGAHDYKLRINSVNPSAVINACMNRNTPIDARIVSLLSGYDLPVAGDILLQFNKDNKLLGGNFDLIASNGAIKLPVRNSLSLNLGKKIDNGKISGSFTENRIRINPICICYGNSSLQLTGIDIPMNMFRLLDVANINGTLSLTNIDVQEMESILPKNITKSIIPIFKAYLPEFKLELIKVDIKGPVMFGERSSDEHIDVGNGVFKIKDAKIPVGNQLVTNVNATGSITDDGFDIRLSSANFGRTKINNGTFFVSNADHSWIGDVNVSIPVDDISNYTSDISAHLSKLPLRQLGVCGTANMRLKLAKIVEDSGMAEKSLPFRVLEGDGTLSSLDNTRSLRFSWGEQGMMFEGNVNTGNSAINIKLLEDFEHNTGNGKAHFRARSEFLTELVPAIKQLCDGDFTINITTNWNHNQQEFDVSADLKDATLFVPAIGDFKCKKDNGLFTAHILKTENGYKFTNVKLESGVNKIYGTMTFNNDGNLTQAVFDTFQFKGCNARINVMRESDNKISASVIGDSLYVYNVLPALKKLDPQMQVHIYADLKAISFSDRQVIKNIKGSIDVKDSQLVSGACYGVIEDKVTLALSVQDTNDGKNNLISLSASDAGAFLKFLGITNEVEGGSINLFSESSSNKGSAFAGKFEIHDFIVKNNAQFNKLMSLSTTNALAATNSPVWFNICQGSMIITEKQIQFANGRAIGPTICISYDGTYDRVADNLNISGVSILVSAIVNSRNNCALSTQYKINGAMDATTLFVHPLKFMDFDTLTNIFGDLLPIAPQTTGIDNSYPHSEWTLPIQNKDTDPFSHKAFDNVHEKQSTNNTTKQRTDRKFGVRITRGINR